MADVDILPQRGVPVLALVDSLGIASNGSQTVAQLAAKGVRSICAVDATGVSVSGATVAQLAAAGIRAFCPVDESGVAQDSSTADTLRARGIRPMVLLGATGIALTGSATMLTLAQRKLGYFCPVDESGNATTMGAVILVTNTTVLESATIGTTVGTLSVAGGTGTYTFTLTDSAGGKFTTAGTNGVNLNVAAALDYETATSHSITISATNGGTPITRTVTITVINVNEFAPVITSNGGGGSASINVAENTTAVTTVTATDADTGAVITYSISGGADAAKFTIGSSSGVLTFVSAPDFETPTDADANNAYIVIVQASDGTNTDTQTVTVTVTDVDEGGGSTTAFALTDISSGRLFQRTKGLTTGPVAASGTYVGADPSAIELQVRKVSDNSVVKAWTTASATIAGGSWSATISGVAQGGSYYVEARPSNVTSLAKTGSNPFYIGVLIVMYGQSNMLFMSSTFSSPPSATAGTTYFDGSAWIAVPGGNGIREMLNALIAATSIPCAALNGAVTGVPIASLTKAGGVPANYAALAAQITASGGDFEFIAWHQGEGDSANGTGQASYLSQLSQLHSDLVTDFGRTKAQAPMVVASLATNTAGSGFGTDASWDAMQRTLIEAQVSLPNVTYSHSNMDAALSDGIHYTAASYGRAGKRYARTMGTLLGSTSGYPKWSIASAAVVDATHTTVDLTHGLGTDFTPTSGITGFQLSNDNGADGFSTVPSAAVRTNATRITLTHASLVTTNARKLRYQYGLAPNVSAPVVDNDALAVPLLMSAGVISPTPLATLPLITYASSQLSAGSGQTQTKTAFTVPGGSASLLGLVGVSMCGGQVLFSSLSVTAQPSASVIAATLVDKWDASWGSTNNPMVGLYQAILPSGTTSVDLSVTFAANPFVACRFHVATIPVADLSSTTKTGSGNNHATTVTNASCTLATTSGGVIFAIGADMSTTGGNTGTFTGTETFRAAGGVNNAILGGGTHTVDSASNVATNASSSVTITFGATAHTTIVTGSWR